MPVYARLGPTRRVRGRWAPLLAAAGILFLSSPASAQHVRIATGRFTVTTGTGNQSITGVGFQPTMGMDGEGNAQLVLPGFGLLYQPSDSFRFEVIVQNPNYYYNPYRYWRR